MAEAPDAPRPIEVFFSYSHKDEKLRDKLAEHLSILKNQGIITAWHDRCITAGREWEGKIDEHLSTAEVILLLISASFLASGYCYDVELKRAMERHEAADALVIPIILRPVLWKGAPFGKLQALPKDAKPVTSWSNRDKAFANVAEGIQQAVEDVQGSSTVIQRVAGDALPWNVPFPRNAWFTGRQDVLAELRRLLTAGSKAALAQTHAISGLGGIGKTQTAVEYAYRYREKYKAVFWLAASTDLELSSAFTEIAGLLGLRHDRADPDSAIRVVKKWLGANSDWLLILDNADDPGLLEPYLPIDAAGHTLLTSRAQVFDTLGITAPVELPSLAQPEAVKFDASAETPFRAISPPLALAPGPLF